MDEYLVYFSHVAQLQLLYNMLINGEVFVKAERYWKFPIMDPLLEEVGNTFRNTVMICWASNHFSSDFDVMMSDNYDYDEENRVWYPKSNNLKHVLLNWENTEDEGTKIVNTAMISLLTKTFMNPYQIIFADEKIEEYLDLNKELDYFEGRTIMQMIDDIRRRAFDSYKLKELDTNSFVEK